MIERPYGQAATVDGIVLVVRGKSDYAVNPTILPGDVQISLDGGPFANITTTPLATPSGSTAIRAVFSAAEMTCKRCIVRFISTASPNKLWEDQELIIETFGNINAQRDIGGEVLSKIDGVESGITLKQAMRAILAVVSGQVSGYPAGPGNFLAPDNTTVRISVVHDANGNRLVVTRNL